MFPKIDVSINQNNTVLIKFEPHENTWSFPNGKKLNLFNHLYGIINSKNESYNANLPEGRSWNNNEFSLKEIHAKVEILLKEWIDAGNLLIKESK